MATLSLVEGSGADQTEGPEIVVPAPSAPPVPTAETSPREPACAASTYCAIPPLHYFDRAVSGLTGWAARRSDKITIGSGLSTAFQWDFNDPWNNEVPYRFMSNDGHYYVELFQVSLGYDIQPAPGDFGANVVFDAGRIARRMKADWNGSGVIPDTTWEDDPVEVQEVYAVYNVPLGRGLALTGGKFVSPLGGESIEPWRNPTFSRSYLFTYGGPFTLTGGTMSYPVTDLITLTAGGVIGWDEVADNNDRPSFLGQLDLQPSEFVNMKIGGLLGPEQTCTGKPGVLPTLNGTDCNSNLRGSLDVVLDVHLREDLQILLNFGWGSESAASQIHPGRHAQWLGFNGTASYEPLDCLTLAARAEWFQDPQGVRLQATAPADPAGSVRTVGTTVWALTFDAQAMLSEHIYLRGEYRYDGSREAIFPSTNSNDQDSYWRGQNTVAIELGYFF